MQISTPHDRSDESTTPPRSIYFHRREPHNPCESCDLTYGMHAPNCPTLTKENGRHLDEMTA